MLLLTRKPGQAITIQPEQGLDFATPVGVLFSHGPIEIRVTQILSGGVRMGITADRQFHILRDELIPYADIHPQVIPRNSSYREILADNLFNIRVQRQWSVQQLADESQLALTTVFALENGRGLIMLDDLDRLASALAVNLSTLLRENQGGKAIEI